MFPAWRPCNALAYSFLAGHIGRALSHSPNGRDMNSRLSTDLGERLLAGDESVLDAILHMHGPPVLALLRQRYGGPLTATDFEDVLATALFRVWQHRARFDPQKASLRVWLFRIAENLARDVLKHGWQKSRQLELSTEPARLAETVDRRSPATQDETDCDAARPIDAVVSTELMREVLALLPDKQRRIVLADADSRDGTVASHQLARELGIPPGTVRVYRRRALERLRREMELRGVLIPAESPD